jgi:hypothetical protein
MKHLFTLIFTLLLFINLIAQTQLDVQGNSSTDTVVKITVNYTGQSDVVGLKVTSIPDGSPSNKGIGGLFIGGYRGILSTSTSGIGVSGNSQTGIGVEGSTQTGDYAISGTNNGSGDGVYGEADSFNSSAVFGQNNKGNGVTGSSTSGTGVEGSTQTGPYAISGTNNGSGNGVFGKADSLNSSAVFGQNNKGNGVFGFSRSSTGVVGVSTSSNGVRGSSTSGIGVVGTTQTGIYAISGTNNGGGHGLYGKADSTSSTGVFGQSSKGTGVFGTSGSSNGVYGESDSAIGVRGKSSTSRGVFGESSTSIGVQGESSTSIGVFGKSSSYIGAYGQSTNNIGVQGESSTSIGVLGTSSTSIGVRGESGSNIGVYGESGSNVGVVGQSGSNVGVVGIGGTFDFLAQGPGTNYGATSSQRWKSNIINISDPLDKISSLRGVYFDWDEDHGGQHDIGFIAEEIGQVIPEIVGWEDNGIDAKGMDYSKMTPLLVEAANAMRKEYQDQIDGQETRIQSLEAALKDLKTLLMAQVKENESSVDRRETDKE